MLLLLPPLLLSLLPAAAAFVQGGCLPSTPHPAHDPPIHAVTNPAVASKDVINKRANAIRSLAIDVHAPALPSSPPTLQGPWRQRQPCQA